MNQEEFHKSYEEASERLYSELHTYSEEELLNIIADEKETKYQILKGKDNYQIWQVLQTKGTEKSLKRLFAIVSDLKNDYLVRYHACNALFKIAKLNDDDLKGQVQYGRNKSRKSVNQKKSMLRLSKVLKLDYEQVTKNTSWWRLLR